MEENYFPNLPLAFIEVSFRQKIRSQKEAPEALPQELGSWSLCSPITIKGHKLDSVTFSSSPKEHLNHIESNLPPYMFGVIMPESKSRCKLELQKQTFSIAKTHLFSFSLITLTHLP